ncbi:uncharacterized protein LOC114539596 [Dendronephthya gigantea]|uniref:uncharacterized protein LOC114539596 n=1 Tax=Dendronephthya gigantea TaxID=151771 RepID=UPI00106B634D|nr:uncharacterized protein LOC114539596 [Dendronephthya gigantea]
MGDRQKISIAKLVNSLKTFKDIAQLSKTKLKHIAKSLDIDVEKSFGKKAILNLVCNGLNISTSSSSSSVPLPQPAEDQILPSIRLLQKLKNWSKSLTGLPQVVDESMVKTFLVGAGYTKADVKKYKTLRAWEHKQGVHSLKVHSLPEFENMWVLRGCCNPSFSTDPEEMKTMYVVMHMETSKPLFAYCTCTVGLRGNCSHVGALLFVLADIIAEGKVQIPSDPTCTDLPCSWTEPKGAKVKPAMVENINIYKAKVGEQPPENKFRPSPAITEDLYKNSDENPLTKEERKSNLRQAILEANMDVYICENYNASLAICCDIEVQTSSYANADNNEIEEILEHNPGNTVCLQEIRERAENVLSEICVSQEEVGSIERETRGQHKNPLWFTHRMPRITASKCKRAIQKVTTSPTKALRDILGYNKLIQTSYMQDGKDSEHKIIEMYEQRNNVNVQPCGFFISVTHPFLGATPDCLVGDEGIIEVKKIHPHTAESLLDALKRQCILKETGNQISFNNNHPYYYQIQQQLFCSRRLWADFVASDGKAIFVLNTAYCQKFWEQQLPRLRKFYYAIILLELAYPRVKFGHSRIGKLGITYESLSTVVREE